MFFKDLKNFIWAVEFIGPVLILIFPDCNMFRRMVHSSDITFLCCFFPLDLSRLRLVSFVDFLKEVTFDF